MELVRYPEFEVPSPSLYICANEAHKAPSRPDVSNVKESITEKKNNATKLVEPLEAKCMNLKDPLS